MSQKGNVTLTLRGATAQIGQNMTLNFQKATIRRNGIL